MDEEITITEEELRQQIEELIQTTLYQELKESKDELRRQLTDIQKNRELIALSEERYKTLVNNSCDVIYSCDYDGIITTINEKFCDVVGLSKEMVIGKPMTDILKDSGYIKEWNTAFVSAINNGKVSSFTYSHELKVGRRVSYYNVTISPLFDLKRKIIGVIGTNHDITTIKENENTIIHMAYYDFVTDLPNRTFFLERLKNAIQLSKKRAAQVIVIILDLDNFKVVNDTLGHAMGDALLVETSKRLLKCIDKKDTVARLGGDEFSLLIENVEQEDDMFYLMKRIKLAFQEPFKITNGTISLTASMGVSIYPDDGDTNEELINNATTAMYKAKRSEKNSYQFFNFNMKHELLKRVNIERLLRKAITNNEFVLYYQPQYTAKGELRGFEALIRWNSPEMGFLNPLEFIPIAEETGLIFQIGEWVLNTASLTCKKFEDIYGYDLIMAVNISPIQLKQNEFSVIVIKAIKSSGLKPTSLELEITESSFIDNYDSVVNKLGYFKELGIRIALDDFGTGYSSLSYLKRLPINLLKIDKSFVREIDFLDPLNGLIESIIALVKKLNIKTMAEGVETLEQLNYLINAKCDYIQGFYLGKPVPEELMGEIIEKALFGK
ncbi:MAG: EAL domain-containing protein [Desulfosporosinus sp.]|nr:EAL domain-containing protein [Desulfosporosinus sp.]